MKFLSVLLGILFSFSLVKRVEASSSYTIEHLGFEKGLTHLAVYSLYQDEFGRIWAGTSGGIMCYNRQQFSEIPTQEENLDFARSMPGNLCGNRNGLMYYSVKSKVIEYDFRTERQTIFSLPFELEQSKMIDISYGKDRLWLWSQNQIYYYRQGRFYPHATLSKVGDITTVRELSDGRLLLGTSTKGLFVMDKSKKLVNLLQEAKNVTALFEDSRKNLWICTNGRGLFVVDQALKVLHINKETNSFRISHNVVRAICEDRIGNVWVGTFSGLDRINLHTGDHEHLNAFTEKPQNLSSLSIRTLMCDMQGSIWVGTYGGGVNYFNPNPHSEVFKLHSLQKESSLSYTLLGKTIEDDNGTFWIASDGKGLLHFDPQTEQTVFYNTENSTLSGNHLKTMYYDPNKQQIWIGTFGKGLNCFDIRTKRFISYRVNHYNPLLLEEQRESIYSLDRYGNNLILGTFSGVHIFDMDRLKCTYLTASKAIRSVLVEGDWLWIASQDGLLKYDLKSRKMIRQYLQDGSIPGLPPSRIAMLKMTRSKHLLMATEGSGLVLFDPKNETFSIFNVHNCGVESNYISSIFESLDGNIFVVTNKGVSRIDLNLKRSLNYNFKNGFPLLSMNSGGILKTRNNELLFTGVNGFVLTDEEKLSRKGSDFNILFDELWINRQRVFANDHFKAIKESLPYVSIVEIAPEENSFSIGISTNNHIPGFLPIYQYQLEGINKEWIDFDPNNLIHYMDLPSGTYQLKVRCRIPGDETIGKQIGITVRVLAPFYARWYMIVLYVLLVLLVAYWVMRNYRSQLLLNTSLDMERHDKIQQEKAIQSKLRFFTNISHEFKTPLTLIMGQLEMLMQSAQIAPKLYKSILAVYSNAQRMNQLIAELLDFRKQEQGYKRLKISEQDLIPFINEIVASFYDYAKFKGVDLSVSTKESSIFLWFDALELGKVINNLLSNAFKHTPQGGRIMVSVFENQSLITIVIEDTGEGISSENLEKIFDRFYQVDDSLSMQQGTGIGLALTKGIVDLHGGVISVKSTIDMGTSFKVELPMGDSHFNESMVERVPTSEDHFQIEKGSLPEYIDYIEEVSEIQNQHFEKKPTLLIVEDNENIRRMLVEIFANLYCVIEAKNGKEGFERALKESPDLVLSDIMMPEMNGNELCRNLKQTFETCHIPVVLLTAQTGIEPNIEGLKRGADDYITKPFNIRILITRCNNLLIGRKILQEKFSQQLDLPIHTVAGNPLDEEFLNKVTRLVEENFNRPTFNIVWLCSELAVGRRIFEVKMKSITGLSPNDFIQNIRLKKAAWAILNRPDQSISDLSEELGYRSLSYFSTSFKQKFGVSPSEYKANR